MQLIEDICIHYKKKYYDFDLKTDFETVLPSEPLMNDIAILPVYIKEKNPNWHETVLLVYHH